MGYPARAVTGSDGRTIRGFVDFSTRPSNEWLFAGGGSSPATRVLNKPIRAKFGDVLKCTKTEYSKFHLLAFMLKDKVNVNAKVRLSACGNVKEIVVCNSYGSPLARYRSFGKKYLGELPL